MATLSFSDISRFKTVVSVCVYVNLICIIFVLNPRVCILFHLVMGRLITISGVFLASGSESDFRSGKRFCVINSTVIVSMV